MGNQRVAVGDYWVMPRASRSPVDAPDARLVALALEGERAAFAVLFDRHRPMATGLVWRVLERREDVDDVLQETAMRALLGLDGLRDPSRFGAWVCGIALNVARQHVRHELRQASDRLASLLPGEPSLIEELLVERETAARVRQAVASLPLGQRQAVQLYYLDDASEAEVADGLGIARSAVKSRLYKARRSLSEQLVEEQDRWEVVMSQPSSLVEVEVTDVRREPLAGPGTRPTHVAVLRERGGTRLLLIFIGEPEGRAMAMSLTATETARPMTYQMAASVIAALSASVTEVRVVRLSGATFVAEVVLAGPSGPSVVDARPSDAINLALVAGAPIRVASELLDQWAKVPEPFEAAEYPSDARAIAAEATHSSTQLSDRQLGPEVVELLAEARREAARRSQVAAGTEHLLLVLLRYSTPERLVLLGVDPAGVEAAVDGAAVSRRPEPDPPLTPRVAMLLWRAERRARTRGDAQVNLDDVLAAMLDESGGKAARLFDDASTDRDAVRAELA